MGGDQSVPRIDPMLMTAEDVANYLIGTNPRMDRYKEAIVENNICGKLILQITDSDFNDCLAEINVTNVLHRKAFRVAFDEFIAIGCQTSSSLALSSPSSQVQNTSAASSAQKSQKIDQPDVPSAPTGVALAEIEIQNMTAKAEREIAEASTMRSLAERERAEAITMRTEADRETAEARCQADNEAAERAFRKGSLTIPSHGGKYEGEIVNCEANGFGVCTWDSGRRKGQRYEGTFANNMRNGRGKINSPDGVVFDGIWVDDKANGRGKLTSPDGAIYDGEWREDERYGRGKQTYSNGDVYEGEWQGNKRNGCGKLTSSNGDVYDGQWKNDAKSP